MPEAVVEQPKVEPEPEVKQRQETDAYITERQKAKEAELNPPPATAAPKEPEKVELTDQQAVDAYLKERDVAKRRQKRGGAQARIDELTKKTAQVEELAKKVADLEAKAVPIKAEEPKKEEPKPAVTKTEQPKMADYTDIDKYNADMALWAASQPKPAAVEPSKEAPKEPPKEAPKPEPISALRKEEFDRFLEAGKKYIGSHPDFNTILEAAHVRGLTMSEGARVAITKLAAPEVAYWLAKPENDLAARKFMALDDFQQVIEIGKIAERLSVKPSDFVSNAPEPGTRLNGGANRSTIPLEQMDTDDYIRERKLQRRQARR